MVGPDGGISIPYAGRVQAAGRTPLAVEHTIESRLEEKAIEPQAIVTIVASPGDAVTVTGDVAHAARVAVPPGDGNRLLDVIAQAGGARLQPYDEEVRLTRNGRVVTLSLERLMTTPQDNIYVEPGDDIELIRAPLTYTVFGATLRNDEIPFGAPTLNLTRAIAKSGGLNDIRANPRGVYLFRFERPVIARELGIPPRYRAPDGHAAVLYRLDMSQIGSYFLADQFPVDRGDMLYVANAPLAELQKFFLVLNSITGPVIAGAVAARPGGS